MRSLQLFLSGPKPKMISFTIIKVKKKKEIFQNEEAGSIEK